jgi:hypothetical protein
MIIQEEIEVKISPSNFNYFKEKGYKFNGCGSIIKIKIKDLNKGSSSKIKCKCCYCEEIKESIYKNYIQQTKDLDKYACSKCSHIKRVETVREVYGVDYTLQVEEYKKKKEKTNLKKYGSITPLGNVNIKEKIKKVNLEKWGFENPFQSELIKEKIKKTNTKNNYWIIDSENFDKYKRRVKTLTNKIKKELFKNWNGYDYYDNEYIKENLNLNKNSNIYPTIDHKISVYYGFINNISPEEISDINNLCITKRFINSSKNKKNEDEFKTN